MVKKDIKNVVDLSKAKLKSLGLYEEVEDWKRKHGLIDIEELELYDDLFNKWKGYDYEYIVKKKCYHFGEVNIFNLVPISCYDINVDKINKLIDEKDVKAWLILDLGCLIGVDIDKLSNVNIYFEPVEDFLVPSFKEMNNIVEFVHENGLKRNVLVSCMAGHGRTGIVLAVWAGLNGISNPVEYIRNNYCKEAVESVTQEMFVNLYLKYIKNLSR